MTLYRDRKEAGEKLADALADYRDKHPLIAAIPRGGVVVAAPVVRRLNGEVDLITPRKVGAPYNPELAAAAVTADGTVIYNRELLQRHRLTEQDLKPRVEAEIKEIKRREKAYRTHVVNKEFNGRYVIVVDDGMATGLTVLAAVQSIKNSGPERLVLAVPVAAAEAVALLDGEVDEVVCPAVPEPFYAVGQFYHRFDQTTDKEVVAVLKSLAGG